MKKILMAIGALVVLLVIAVFVVPALMPAGVVKQVLLDRINAATGRTAHIDGKVGFTILPQLSFFADNVALANAPGAAPTNMVTVGRLSARIALMPLLSGHVVARSFVLYRPVINLSVDKGGRPNWRFAPRSARVGAAVGTRGPGGGGAPGFLKTMTSGELQIVDGRITYADARSGARDEADFVDLHLSMPSLDQPLAADGSLTWRKERIRLSLHLADPGAALANKPVAVNGTITAKLLHVGFKGTLRAGVHVTANGTLSMDAPSIGRLAAWIGDGRRYTPGPTVVPLKLHSEAALAGASIALRHAAFSLGAIKGAGDMRFDGAGARPYIAAKLTLGKVDLDPHRAAPSAATPAAARRDQAPPRTPAAHNGSARPVDLALLKRVDGNFDLTFAGLAMGKWQIGPSHLSIGLKDGRLTSDLDRMALYGGGAKATMTLDAAAVPRMTLSCKLSGVQLKPLLAAAADTERLEGAANLDLQVAGDGNSRRDILSSLSGNGRIEVRNGALRGIDLTKLLGSAESALNNLATAQAPAVTGPSKKTAFSRLSGTYTIRRGILFNKDLSLRGSQFAADGQGSANLMDHTLDYRLNVKLYSPSKIRIAGVTMSELTVPIVVTGPWGNPSYRPDLAAALRHIAKGRVLRELKKRIPGVTGEKGLGGLLHNVPGGAGKALQKLFGR